MAASSCPGSRRSGPNRTGPVASRRNRPGRTVPAGTVEAAAEPQGSGEPAAGLGAWTSTPPRPRAASAARSSSGVPARIGNVP